MIKQYKQALGVGFCCQGSFVPQSLGTNGRTYESTHFLLISIVRRGNNFVEVSMVEQCRTEMIQKLFMGGSRSEKYVQQRKSLTLDIFGDYEVRPVNC